MTALASQAAGDLCISDEDMMRTEHVDQLIKIQSAATTAISGVAMGVDNPTFLAQFAQRGDGDDVHALMVFLRNVTPCPHLLLRKAARL